MGPDFVVTRWTIIGTRRAITVPKSRVILLYYTSCHHQVTRTCANQYLCCIYHLRYLRKSIVQMLIMMRKQFKNQCYYYWMWDIADLSDQLCGLRFIKKNSYKCSIGRRTLTWQHLFHNFHNTKFSYFDWSILNEGSVLQKRENTISSNLIVHKLYMVMI